MSDKGYLAKKLRKIVNRRKSAGGMEAGLPTVHVDLYELERILNDLADLRPKADAFDVLKEAMRSIAFLGSSVPIGMEEASFCRGQMNIAISTAARAIQQAEGEK